MNPGASPQADRAVADIASGYGSFAADPDVPAAIVAAADG